MELRTIVLDNTDQKCLCPDRHPIQIQSQLRRAHTHTHTHTHTHVHSFLNTHRCGHHKLIHSSSTHIALL